VLFRVASYAKYGALSRRSRADMIAGARVEVAPYKEDPGDFVLWKPSSPELPGWPSPWGRGRPGWHIECSAMCENTLGETFDIHGGGLDLVFPHHENEIAQSVSAHDGRPFARYWLHNGMLTVRGVKMAKSERNFITVRDVLAKAPGEIVRLALLMTHYRDPLDWTQARLLEAETIHGRLYRALVVGGFELETEPSTTAKAIQPVVDALSDDLNSHEALNCLRGLTEAIYKTADASERRILKGALRRGGSLLGILGREDLSNWLNPILNPAVEWKIQERTRARQERRFADADKIRTELFSEGILLEDKPDGTTTWTKVHTLPFEQIQPSPSRRK
jgi:cysteinyl-tRNA synthetase